MYVPMDTHSNQAMAIARQNGELKKAKVGCRLAREMQQFCCQAYLGNKRVSWMDYEYMISSKMT